MGVVSTRRISALCAAGLTVLTSYASLASTDAGSDKERQALKAVCGKCHNLEIVTDTPRSYDEWQDTIQKMVDRGARGTDAQFDAISDYLYRNLTPIDVNSADAAQLQAVLDVSTPVADAIISRRSVRKFASLADLKTVTGIDPAALNAKFRLLFFQ
jgi:Helix-hairpin-helix motif